jgi:hypothetical protein
MCSTAAIGEAADMNGLAAGGQDSRKWATAVRYDWHRGDDRGDAAKTGEARTSQE